MKRDWRDATVLNPTMTIPEAVAAWVRREYMPWLHDRIIESVCQRLASGTMRDTHHNRNMMDGIRAIRAGEV